MAKETVIAVTVSSGFDGTGCTTWSSLRRPQDFFSCSIHATAYGILKLLNSWTRACGCLKAKTHLKKTTKHGIFVLLSNDWPINVGHAEERRPHLNPLKNGK